MLPEEDVVQNAELELAELGEGRLGEVEPLTEGAGVAVVNNLDGHLVTLVHEGDLVTALEGGVGTDGRDEVLVVGAVTTASGVVHHVARVVGNTAVLAAGLELGGSSQSNANESKEDGQEESSTHC